MRLLLIHSLFYFFFIILFIHLIIFVSATSTLWFILLSTTLHPEPCHIMGSFYTSAKHIFHLHWNSLNKLNTLGVQSHRKVLIPLIKGYYKYLKTSTSITTLPFTAIAFLVISFSELILCMLCFTSTKSESQLQFQLSKPFLALYHTPILKFLNTKHWFVNFLKCIYQFTRMQ